MILKDVLKQINNGREKIEACFVFSVWSEPELYDDYKLVNAGKDQTLKNKDAQFYWELGRSMYDQGLQKFDAITLETYLTNKPGIKKKFEEYGGYATVEQLRKLVTSDNTDAYYDKISKMNSFSMLAEGCEDIFTHLERFEDATNEDIYNTFDLLNNSISLNSSADTKIENLIIDEEFINDCNAGIETGLSYASTCPILNYITLGIPLGEMFMLGAQSGVGKSSFVFENLLLALNANGIKTAIVSNEMRVKAYKQLLLSHILTKDLDYWDLTRKRTKMGHFSDDQMDVLRKTIKISEDKYGDIRFVKLFDNDVIKVLKYIRKLAHQGYQCIVWDTMKSDDVVDEAMWQSLMINSRKVFQVASKNNISIITTFQLAPATLNQRFLDVTCLANSKQVKEVFSEMIYMRPLWADEYTDERYDCKVFKLDKDENGKSRVKNYLKLNPEKKYIVFFVDKTRNDEDKQQVLFEFNGRFNRWIEIGRCYIYNDHR